MRTRPIAKSVTLAESVAVGLLRTQGRTQGSEVHKAWEGDDPIVLGISNPATIELEERSTLDTGTTGFGTQLTKKLSASKLFKRNVTFGTTLMALE